MIDMHSKYVNMHKNGMFYALICINSHIIASENCMLLVTPLGSGGHVVHFAMWLPRDCHIITWLVHQPDVIGPTVGGPGLTMSILLALFDQAPHSYVGPVGPNNVDPTIQSGIY